MKFAYHRSLAPMIGVLLGIAIVEMLVVHLVVVAWLGWKAALVAGVLDASLVIALIGLIRSFRRLPVTLLDGVLTMRAGSLRTVCDPGHSDCRFARQLGCRGDQAARRPQPRSGKLAKRGRRSRPTDRATPRAPAPRGCTQAR